MLVLLKRVGFYPICSIKLTWDLWCIWIMVDVTKKDLGITFTWTLKLPRCTHGVRCNQILITGVIVAHRRNINFQHCLCLLALLFSLHKKGKIHFAKLEGLTRQDNSVKRCDIILQFIFYCWRTLAEQDNTKETCLTLHMTSKIIHTI